MATITSLYDNYHLRTLDLHDCPSFRKDLKLVEVHSQQYLAAPNIPMTHVYFPTSCVISLQCLAEDGVAIEVGVVGREGIVGTSLTGGGNSHFRAMVQRSGFAYRLEAGNYMREFDRNIAVQRASFRYSQALLTQVAQSVLCKCCHSVDQHLCRWLLDTLDRISSNELTATHERIANMLGVRRESVTMAAGKLKNAGLISFRRGHIKVLNREALEARACECYQIIKQEFEGLLSTNHTRPFADGKEAENSAALFNKSAAYQRQIVRSNATQFRSL